MLTEYQNPSLTTSSLTTTEGVAVEGQHIGFVVGRVLRSAFDWAASQFGYNTIVEDELALDDVEPENDSSDNSYKAVSEFLLNQEPSAFATTLSTVVNEDIDNSKTVLTSNELLRSLEITILKAKINPSAHYNTKKVKSALDKIAEKYGSIIPLKHIDKILDMLADLDTGQLVSLANMYPLAPETKDIHSSKHRTKEPNHDEQFLRNIEAAAKLAHRYTYNLLPDEVTKTVNSMHVLIDDYLSGQSSTGMKLAVMVHLSEILFSHNFRSTNSHLKLGLLSDNSYKAVSEFPLNQEPSAFSTTQSTVAIENIDESKTVTSNELLRSLEIAILKAKINPSAYYNTKEVKSALDKFAEKYGSIPLKHIDKILEMLADLDIKQRCDLGAMFPLVPEPKHKPKEPNNDEQFLGNIEAAAKLAHRYTYTLQHDEVTKTVNNMHVLIDDYLSDQSSTGMKLAVMVHLSEILFSHNFRSTNTHLKLSLSSESAATDQNISEEESEVNLRPCI